MKPTHATKTVMPYTSGIAKHTPEPAQPSQHRIVGLQRLIGNQSVQRLIGSKKQTGNQQEAAMFGGLVSQAQATPAIQREEPTDAPKAKSGNNIFAVTDKEAKIREAPPNLDVTDVAFTRGSKVKVLDKMEHKGKWYVLAQEVLPEGMLGPLRYGWTSASNLSNHAGIIPGLRAMPNLDNPAFQSIMDAIAQLEQTSLEIDDVHAEEIGTGRDEFVQQIGLIRSQIAALPETDTHADESEIREAQAHFYRRLMPLSPYSGQMGNTNMMLSAKGNEGWNRTCNMTVVSMVLEGIGKTRDDFDQSKIPLMQDVFDALQGKYKKRKVHEAATDFEALRFPDFVTLAAITSKLSGSPESVDEKQFVKAVGKAQGRAAALTTSHELMMEMVEAFGGQHEKHNVYYNALDKIGGKRKGYTKQKLRGLNPTAEQKSAYKSVDADKLLDVEKYRDAVLEKINPLLDSGAQIIVGMENHFVRLDALDENTVQVDDPGEKGFKSMQVTWEQARDLGYFKGFWAITG